MHHYYAYGFDGGFQDNKPIPQGFNATNIVLAYPHAIGTLGVNIFVMISGYFSCKSGYSARKILQLILQEEFYAILILLVLGISKVIPFESVSIYRHVLSVAYNSDYWFGYTFVGLMLLGDYINIVLKALDKSACRRGIINMGIYFCVLQTLNNAGNYFYGIDAVLQFIYLYIIGAYLQLHPEPIFAKAYRWVWLLVFVVVISIVAFVPMTYSYVPTTKFSQYYLLNLDMRDRVTELVAALALFVFFMNIDIGSSRIINTISSTTFAVYLMHENEQMRTVWWRKVFRQREYYENTGRVAWMLPLAVVVIFASAIVIDLFRQYVVEKFLFFCLDWLALKIWGKDKKDKAEGEEGEKKGGRGGGERSSVGVDGGESGLGGGSEGVTGSGEYGGSGDGRDTEKDERTPLRDAEEGDGVPLYDESNYSVQNQV